MTNTRNSKNIKMPDNLRYYSPLDEVIASGHSFLETLFNTPRQERKNPAQNLDDSILNPSEKKESIGFMRVNHSGEICAQALYQGQMIFSKNPKVKTMLATAAEEEIDHLAWCQERIYELGGHTSYLNPFWYTNAFLIGVLAGLAGDKFSLGFVEETERQVEAHLETHLHKLPLADIKSRTIVEQMKKDEVAHREKAKLAGAEELPQFIKKLMSVHAKVMTTLAYWI